MITGDGPLFPINICFGRTRVTVSSVAAADAPRWTPPFGMCAKVEDVVVSAVEGKQRIWLKMAPAKSAGGGSSDYIDGSAKQVASRNGASLVKASSLSVHRAMGLELAVREPPSLPPIRTSGNDAKLHEESPSKSGNDEDVDCCGTPKSEETAVKPVLLCPPAPKKKPRPAKRRCSSPQERYFPVPDDLTLVFIPVPCPATKKARVA
ncbi:hypothetical protein B296_00001641 [Ensete ventricosum]|uniref:Uncharacterized protein n=2 Tax=Ensete ventricosum TaxID=4639 RepID=A0A427B518_ENSVE|nr:hypothetical protein B296_00001641 [Ensete ventricosum]